jgi:hypothetical protein
MWWPSTNLNARLKTVFILFCINLFLGASTFAQTYSSDLDDFKALESKINPIGDLGDIDKILDLRGFVPFSGISKEKSQKQESSIFNFFSDIFQWYKFPTAVGVSCLYYGSFDDHSKAKLQITKILAEDKLEGEDKEWAKFAYGLAHESGKDLFTSANGSSSGFDSAEPVNVLLTEKSAFVIMNFKYSSLDRRGTGQILCAYEFSRTLKEYKSYYELYSNTVLSRSVTKAFSASEPYIAKAVAIYFTGQ